MLSPHTIIETILDMGPDHPSWQSPQTLRGVVALMQKATLFRFGHVHPSMEHKEFALDLYERGLFRLPFPVTAFAFEGMPNPTVINMRGAAASGMMLVHQDEDNALSAIMCTEQRDLDGAKHGGVPIGIILRAKLSDSRDGSVKVDEATYPLIAPDLMAMMYGDAGEAGHEVMRQRLCSNLVGCMGMAVMLMSKGVVADLAPAPEKLNRVRLAKGKPRIGDSYTVKLSLGDVRSIATEGGEESIAGHTRGTPRPHWRRGHFRTLNRGSETERVVPVAPCLVGLNDTATDVKSRAYEVRP